MAGSSLLTLIDDIATLLDDVAVLSKVAAKKTAGVLGDDLALNAQQVSGVKAEREIPVVWAVAKGSFVNKLILVPGALLLSAFLPWLIIPLLMLGGGYLCYEGCEKIFHKFFHKKQKATQQREKHLQAVSDPQVDLRKFEAKKIKGAIRTDFILSAEIIVIALGTVQAKPLLTQALVLSFIAIAITIGVYGLVAAIVKLDDAGLYLVKANSQKNPSRLTTIKCLSGQALLWFAPFLMKTLSVLGTLAMFLVGGGIFVHAVDLLHRWEKQFRDLMLQLWQWSEAFAFIWSSLFYLVFGLLLGGLILMLVNGIKIIVVGKAH